MKVLWFTNTPVGATEKLTGNEVTGGGWLYAMSEELVRNNQIDLHIAFYWHQQIPSFTWKGITYHPILMEHEGSRFGRLINRFNLAYCNNIDAKALPRLLAIVNEVTPDIIHVHGSEGNFGLIAKESLPCPIVLSIQGLLTNTIRFFYRGLTKTEILRSEKILTKLVLGGINNGEKMFERNGKREREILKSIDHIIGRTFWDKASTLAINPYRHYYEVGEIMRSEFYSSQWTKEEYSTIFIITSTISSGIYKGIEAVFQTALVLKSAGFVFQWNIIGTDSKDPIVHLSQKKVKSTAEKLGIKFLGRKNASEIVQLMIDADLYVQVSHVENSPNSLCEAMLLGMPIIATFAGGTASMLENNVEGRLLQDGEPYSMAGMIMEMAGDYDKAKTFGQNARAKALLRHNPEFVCNQLLTAYHSILNNENV